ncbi:MAG: hypothetical protein RL757_1794, partial [Bacteroidota bacterium]
MTNRYFFSIFARFLGDLPFAFT